MGMTITEKILAAHCGRRRVAPGEFINAAPDLMMANDVTAPPAIAEFERIGNIKPAKPGRVVLINDHFTPNKDIPSAEQALRVREFAVKHRLRNFFDVGRAGVCHAIVPEHGLVAPGDLAVGADSHTCTYGALGAFATGVGSTDIAAAWATGKIWLRVPETIRVEFAGRLPKWVGGKDLILHLISTIGVDGARYRALEFAGGIAKRLSIFDRLTVANMAVEAGAKNGIFVADKKAFDYLRGRTKKKGKVHESDPDADYAERLRLDVSKLTPLVACPHSPDNVRPVGALRKVRVDQVFIGSCTNGWLSDLKIAARLLRGKKVAAGVRLIVIPPTPGIYTDALKEGIVETFLRAGAAVGTPTCGPCLGGHHGVLAGGEVALSTTNRNFLGRMGHPKSKVYLASPAVAAATAVRGKITHPEKI